MKKGERKKGGKAEERKKALVSPSGRARSVRCTVRGVGRAMRWESGGVRRWSGGIRCLGIDVETTRRISRHETAGWSQAGCTTINLGVAITPHPMHFPADPRTQPRRRSSRARSRRRRAGGDSRRLLPPRPRSGSDLPSRGVGCIIYRDTEVLLRARRCGRRSAFPFLLLCAASCLPVAASSLLLHSPATPFGSGAAIST